MASEMLWLGDGFNSGRTQIGQPVVLNGKTGVVVEGSDLTITVCWNAWYKRLLRTVLALVGRKCPWCGKYHS
jgi:hypothetical protein